MTVEQRCGALKNKYWRRRRKENSMPKAEGSQHAAPRYRRCARHHPPQPAEASEPAAARRPRRADAIVRPDRGRSRDQGAGAHRHRPRFSAGYDLGSIAERATSAPEQQTAGSAFEVVVNRLEDLGCRRSAGSMAASMAARPIWRWPAISASASTLARCSCRRRGSGLHYYTSGIKRYVSRLGADNARKLFLTAEKIGAAEMLRIGYLTAMVPAGGARRGGRPAGRGAVRQCAGRDGRHEARHQRVRPWQAG